MNDYWAAQLQARQIQEDTGMTMDQILALPADEWARLTNRQTPAQAAIAALDAQFQGHSPAPQQQAPAPAQPPTQTQAPETPDFASMDMATYAAYREQAGIGRGAYGRGALDGTAGTAEWAAAARARTGRTGLSQHNVTDAPRLDGRYVDHDAQRDTRTAAQRFATPGNAYQGR